MFKSILTLSGANLFFSISSFISLAVVTKIIGLTQFGLFAFSLSIAAILQVAFNTQSWQGILKNDKFSKAIVSYCFLIDLFFATLASLVYLLVIKLLTIHFTDAEFMNWQYIIALLIFSIPNGTCLSIIRKFQLYNEQAKIDVVASIIRLVLILLCFFFKTNTFLTILVYVSADFIKSVGYFKILISNFNSLVRADGTFSQINKIYSFSIWGVFNEIMHLPASQLDRIICATFISLEVLGVYDIFKRVCTSSIYITNPIMQICYPDFISKVKNTSINKSMSMLFKIVFSLLLVLSFLYFTIYLTRYSWAELAFSISIDEWTEGYDILLSLFCISLLFTFSFIPIHPFYLALGFAKRCFYISLVGAFFYIITITIIAMNLPFYYLPLAIFISDLTIIILKILDIRRSL